MKEQIPIKPHLRKGKLVKGHFRTIKTAKYPELKKAYKESKEK